MKITNKTFFTLILIILLSSCAGSKTNKILKQGNVAQEDFKTTIPFKYVMGWIVLEVEIEHKNYNFLLDTGSSNILTSELAEELNSTVIGNEEVSDINNKKNSTKYTKINSIKIGGIDFQETIAGIIDLNKVTEISCTKIDGIIGANLMRKAVWDFDFQKQLITITNDENNLDIPDEAIESKMYIGTAGDPSVTLKINGKKTLNNAIDFGNSGSNLMMRSDYFQKQLDAKLINNYVTGNGKAFGAFGYSKSKAFYNTIINELVIGNHTTNNIFTSIRSGSGNNLGLEFFKNYRVILNWKKKKIKMVEITKAGNDSFNTYGFSTVYEKEKGVCVNNIIENSNAAKFLENGDVIKKINNTSFPNGSIEEYCNYLSSKNSKENLAPLLITVLRNNTELNFRIDNASLL
jgi:predicted aspartyl protease